MPSRLNLLEEMKQIGGWFQKELETAVHKQTDLDGNHFWPVMYATAQARQRASNRIQRVERAKGRKGRIPGTVAVRSTSGAVNQDRLLFTRRFVNGAFRFAPFRDYVKVFTWPGTYPGTDVSFRDIVNYNNKGSSRVNPHITSPPKIFPIGDAEVQKMTAYKNAVALMNSPKTLKKVGLPRAKKLIEVLI
jgi:hypothetical protein